MLKTCLMHTRYYVFFKSCVQRRTRVEINFSYQEIFIRLEIIVCYVKECLEIADYSGVFILYNT